MNLQPSILHNRQLPGPLAYVFFTLWFVTVLVLGNNGFFRQPSGLPLTHLQLFIIGPMVIFWLAYFLIPGVKAYVLRLDFRFLNLLQVLRVLGLAILVLWGYGMIPGGFAIPMSLLDASVGVLAIVVVLSIVDESHGWQRRAWVLNVWGFLDFIVTIALALFAFKALPFDPVVEPKLSASLLEPPLALFPGFAIPFFSIIHFAAFAQLRQESRRNQHGGN